MSVEPLSDQVKHSGIEWLGMIPAHWSAYPIQRAVISMCDGPFGSDMKSTHYTDDGVRVIRLQNIGIGFFADDDKAYISHERFNSLPGHDVKPGDLLVAGLGDQNHPVGRACVYPHDSPVAMVKADCFRVRLNPTKLDHRFAALFLSSHIARAGVAIQMRGSTRERMNLTGLSHLEIPVPPLPEQRAIAAFLDRKTAQIDAVVAKKRRLIQRLQEKRQALISHAVTKGLDSHAPMKDSGCEWIGEIPEHWSRARTRLVARLESGHTPSRNHPEYWVNCNLPWFTLADVWQLRDGSKRYVHDTKELVSEMGLANSSARLLPKNTVILSRTASVGFSAIMAVPMATTQDFVNWVCGPRIVPTFLLWVFRGMKQEFDRLMMGSTHKTIYMPDAEQFSTPLPPHPEQQAIAEFLNRKTAQIDAVNRRVIQQITKLQEYRQTLISAAVTGKIDVTKEADQDSRQAAKTPRKGEP